MPPHHLENWGTATKAGSLRLSPSHAGVTQGQAAATGHEWRRRNFGSCPKGCWEAEGEEGKNLFCLIF